MDDTKAIESLTREMELARHEMAAQAVWLRQSDNEAIVLTEERRDRPDKISMTTACGMPRIHVLPMEAFLREKGIWTRPA